MTSLNKLLAALPDDDAGHLRDALRELAKMYSAGGIQNDPQFDTELGPLLDEFALLHGARERSAAGRAGIKRKPRPSRFVAKAVTSAIFICLGVFAIATMSQTTYMRSFSQKILAEISERKRDEISSAGSIDFDQSSRADHIEMPKIDGGERTVANQPTMAETAPKVIEPQEEIKVAAADRRLESAVNKPQSLAELYRTKAVAAYQAAHLSLALVYFDLVVQQEPEKADGYIDRSIVYYRMGDIKKAFADIDRARNIDAAKDALGP